MSLLSFLNNLLGAAMARMGETESASETGFIDGGGVDHVTGLQTIADRHGVSLDAVRHLVQALERGHGRMAQFDHPDLGGMGQWSAGGMTMVGRMFDDGLRARVAALCTELAATLPAEGFATQDSPETWWPGDLGHPSATGSQNGMRYAYFPTSRRLAVEEAAGVVVYDTGEHAISGVSQANGLLRFTGSAGPIALDTLKRIGAEAPEPKPATPEAAQGSGGDILATIERLADLHTRGVLTAEEFQAKKAELLARL